MLSHLKVSNYALIKDLEVQFGPNWNVITGETGTGKSILLGALGLILGNRADTSVLSSELKKCVVEGTFQIQGYPLQAFFEENDLDYENPTILRREISPSGKSRAFINDTPVTLNILRRIGDQLVDIHSQHQTLKLNDKAFQLSILDGFANHGELLKTYQQAFNRYRELKSRYDSLVEQQKQVNRDFDYYQFQASEIAELDPKEGELETLEQEVGVLSNADAIKTNLQEAINLLYHSDYAIQTQLAEVKDLLQQVASHYEKIEHLQQRIDSLEIEAKDIADETSNLEEDINVDNQRLEEANNRLQRLNQVLNKHGFQNIRELLDYYEEIQEKVQSASSLNEEIESVNQELKTLEEKLHELADQLSANREAQIPQVENNLIENLQFVGMPEPSLSIRLTRLEDPESFNRKGKDQIEILFSANKGSTAKPINQVASGGELSRLMLCIKYLTANTLFLPTIIFDEIDMGISGDIAIKVGKLIKKLAENHQVVSITHLPQVASMGQHHFMVYKVSEEEKTFSHMKVLNEEERVGEIANMLAGAGATETTYQNARELMGKTN